MIGAVANILRSQGINILLNIFFNPAVNAARAIAYQVNSAVTNFTNNFYTAVRPQIFKNYASGNFQDMHSLVMNSSRYAYLLMLFLVGPLFCETEGILFIWLKQVPDYAVFFTRLILISALLEVFSFPLVSAIQATGNIKLYQITVSVVYLFNIPISYFFLKQGFPPETTMIVNIVLVIISFIPRLCICKRIVGFPIGRFMVVVFLKVCLCTLVYAVLLYFLKEKIHTNLFLEILLEMSVCLGCVLFIGVSKIERQLICAKVKRKIHL
jgi:O-antigen/teichoic acid export membrane protein